MRYEEEAIIELGEEKSKIFCEYVGVIRQIELIMFDQSIYGHSEDDYYPKRKQLLKDFYELLFQNPMQALRLLKEYQEPQPERSVFIAGHDKFRSWVNGIIDAYSQTQLCQLSQEQSDLRALFLSILNLRSMPYSQTYIKQLPQGAALLEGGEYSLPFGISVGVYKIPNQDSPLYVQFNPSVENLPPNLAQLLKDAVQAELKQIKETVDFTTIFEQKMRQFRQDFLDVAHTQSIPLEPNQALAMGREAAAWSVGLGSPVENLALDRKNITDIYIDAQNAAIYIEHQQFGLCHTLWQYNQEMLERMFTNIVATQSGTRKFDKENPIIDVMLTRLAMRCHLQRPPATFGDLQAALRLMKDDPFTYPEYLKYKSFPPFFAGYDDVLVGLGCSEAVLGLKGVGKTAFTSAKISAIGLKRRILPIQDIEEIPVKAYRKRGFHIGAVRVAASDRDDVQSTSELDLVSMTNAALRMGDSCVIINEIRSRTAIQGVINMLNTQPGIFMLYNLHAQSLKDIQDRLELVFGMPAASMYSTDRYSFLRKVRFGRKSRMYRLLGTQYESDMQKRQFVPVFTLERGEDIDSTSLTCNFCPLPEASSKELYNADLGQIAKKLKLKFIPPALQRRSEEAGLPVNDYIMEAFYKGKLYDLIYRAYLQYGLDSLLEIDFVLKCLTDANNILHEREQQTPDWGEYDSLMMERFNNILQKELSDYEQVALQTGQKNPLKNKSAPTANPPNTSRPSQPPSKFSSRSQIPNSRDSSQMQNSSAPAALQKQKYSSTRPASNQSAGSAKQLQKKKTPLGASEVIEPESEKDFTMDFEPPTDEDAQGQ